MKIADTTVCCVEQDGGEAKDGGEAERLNTDLRKP